VTGIPMVTDVVDWWQ